MPKMYQGKGAGQPVVQELQGLLLDQSGEYGLEEETRKQK